MFKFFTAAFVGWLLSLAGLGIWLLGYFLPGRAPLVDWQAIAPSFIADYLPSLEAEIGFAVMIVGSAVIYWPKSQKQEPGAT